MRTLLLVAAERLELEGVLARCSSVERLRWPVDFAARGVLKGTRLILAANGPGPKLAAEAVETACGLEEIEGIVSTGTCGGLDPDLRCGDIFVASEVRALDAGVTYVPQPLRSARLFRSGPLVSADRVVSTAEEKRRLRATGAGAVEMEAAGVAARASEHGLPFFCVRVVMDGASESFALDLNRFRDASGRFSRWGILRAALFHPWVVVPEMILLRRTCAAASRALGEFFAECQF